MSYGMNHEEFIAATGITDGTRCTIYYEKHPEQQGIIEFYWYGGVGFDGIKAVPDGAPVLSDGRHLGETVHQETDGAFPFNHLGRYDFETPLPRVIAVRVGNQMWGGPYAVQRAEAVRRLADSRRELEQLPAREKYLRETIAKLEGELAQGVPS